MYMCCFCFSIWPLERFNIAAIYSSQQILFKRFFSGSKREREQFAKSAINLSLSKPPIQGHSIDTEYHQILKYKKCTSQQKSNSYLLLKSTHLGKNCNRSFFYTYSKLFLLKLCQALSIRSCKELKNPSIFGLNVDEHCPTHKCAC